MARTANLGRRERSGVFEQNTTGLRFKTKDDARDYAVDVMERSHEWAIAHGVRVPAEDYVESQCEIILEFKNAPWGNPCDFQLVMQVIPFVDNEFCVSCIDNSLSERAGVLEASADDFLMGRSSKIAHRPQ